jgi:hypothetical protein
VLDIIYEKNATLDHFVNSPVIIEAATLILGRIRIGWQESKF